MIAWLVETLIATSGLMLVVLILRKPVRQSFGAKAVYALWLLPALRMVMPPIASLMPQSLPTIAIVPSSGALSQLVRARVMQIDPASSLSIEPASAISWPLIAAGLWVLGVLAFAAWQILSYRAFCKHVLAGARVRRSPARGIKLLASARVSGPLAFGIRRRFIVFPQDALMRFDVEEHAMALAHELAHHRRGDLLANAVALGVLALHWCNPLAWYAHRAFRNDQEMACDADVIDAIRDSGLGHAYGRALVKSASGREVSAICHLNTVDRLKRRLSMLSKQSPSTRRRLTGLALIGGFVVSGLALTASGEGMAAQVGAKVSDVLPIPRRQDLLPSLSTAPAAVAAHAQEQAERAERLAIAAETRAGRLPPVPPTPPAPPLAQAAPQPPAPPAPSYAEAPQIPPVPAIPAVPPIPPVPHVAISKHRQIIRIDNDRLAAIPTRAEIDAMVPIIEVTQGKGCAPGQNLVNSSEERVSIDGRTRQKISIVICDKAVARQARQEALQGLQEARNDIANERDLSDQLRRQITSDLDRQIARLRTGRE